MSLYKKAFIDENYFINIYQTAFITEWNELTVEEKDRFIELSSTRIKRIVERPFVDLDDLEQEQADAVQVAVSILIDYWLEYGLDLNRISGSVSMGSYSASQTVPNDPDYVPQHAYDRLTDAKLYSPVSYSLASDIDRYDDEGAITYGVRFRTLERIKDIYLDKLASQDNNIDLHMPTTDYVMNLITEAIADSKEVIGTYQVNDINELLNLPTLVNTGTILTLTNGATFSRTNDVGTSIFVIDNGTNDGQILPETMSVIDTNTVAYTSNNNSIGITVDEIRQIIAEIQADYVSRSEGDVRYIRTDGSNSMNPGYVPGDTYALTNKGYVDTENQSQNIPINSNTARIVSIEDQLSGGASIDVAESKLTWAGTITGTGTNNETVFVLPITANVSSPGSTFDYSDGQTLEIGLTDSVATSTVSITIGQPSEENWYFKDENIGVIGRIDMANPGELIVTQVSGGGNITNLLMLSKVNQIRTFASFDLAKVSDLVTKQDIVDNSLATTIKTVPGAINEVNSLSIQANDEAMKGSNYNTMFSVNYGYEQTIGIIQGDMYARILPYITSGRLNTGNSMAVRFRNGETGGIENCTNAELISYTPTDGNTPGEILIGLDLWITGNEEYKKGTLQIIENGLLEASAIEVDQYAFVGDTGDRAGLWNINTADKASVGITSGAIYDELLRMVNEFQLTTGDPLKVQYWNSTTGRVEQTANAELELVEAGKITISLDLAVNVNDDYYKGKLIVEDGNLNNVEPESKEFYQFGGQKYIWKNRTASEPTFDYLVAEQSTTDFTYAVINNTAGNPSWELTNVSGKSFNAKVSFQAMYNAAADNNAFWIFQINATGTSTINRIEEFRSTSKSGTNMQIYTSPEIIINPDDIVRIYANSSGLSVVNTTPSDSVNKVKIEYEERI